MDQVRLSLTNSTWYIFEWLVPKKKATPNTEKTGQNSLLNIARDVLI